MRAGGLVLTDYRPYMFLLPTCFIAEKMSRALFLSLPCSRPSGREDDRPEGPGVGGAHLRVPVPGGGGAPAPADHLVEGQRAAQGQRHQQGESVC